MQRTAVAGGPQVRRLQGKTTTINSQTMIVHDRDTAGNVSACTGAAAPTDAGAGYAIGCIFRLTTGNGIGSTMYINEGSAASCDFNAVASPEVGDISSVVAGNGLSGGGVTGAVTLDVGPGRGTTVRTDAVDVGLDVYNATGGLLAAGTLVYLSGFDTTLGITIAKADADAGLAATHVVVDAIGIANAGVVYPWATVTGQNTGGRTIGDAVYLDATTAGGFVFAAPTGIDQVAQIVGYVKVVDAATGEIAFCPGSRFFTKVPNSWLQANAVTLAKFVRSDATGKIPIGQGAGADAQYAALSGDVTMDGSGAVTIANSAVSAAKVADSDGTGALRVRKFAQLVYDFAVSGGAQGFIALAGAPTIPDNAVVFVESYDILTTFTSGGADAATVTVSLPTDGNLFTATAISDASNPLDQGVFVMSQGLLDLTKATPKKTTAARVPGITVAGGNDLTAGKAVFNLSYWVTL